MFQKFFKKEERALPVIFPSPINGIGTALNAYSHDRAAQLPTYLACESRIAEALASVPLRAFIVNENGSRAAMSDTPLATLLSEQVNDGMTAFEFRELLVRSILRHGNGYALKSFDNSGQVINLTFLPATNITIEQLPSGRLRYRYRTASGQTFVYLQDEILHIRYASRDGVMGLSPLQLAAPQIQLSLSLQNEAIKSSENGFRSPSVLTIDKILTDAQRKTMRENLTTIGQSGQNLMVLEAGMKHERTAASPAENEFVAQLKLSDLAICRIMGVSPSVAGITDNATYSNVADESRAFVTRCLAPFAARIEASLTMQLLTPAARKKQYIEHDLQGLLRGDMTSRYGAYKTAREAGFLSVNEIRKYENLSAIDGGDEYLRPLNHTIAGDPTTQAT